MQEFESLTIGVCAELGQGRIISASLGGSRKFRRLVIRDGLIGEFAQCLFVLIVASTDTYGLCKGDAESLKLEVFQASLRSEQEFEAALGLMEEVELIKRYEAEGEVYLEVQNFDRYQPGLRPRGDPRRGKPWFPAPPWLAELFQTFPDPSNGMPMISETLPLSPSLSALSKPMGESKREREGGTGGKPTRQMTDDEYLDHLQANPAYALLPVRHVYGKMVAWCETKGKRPSRARLVSWLNREEQPMTSKRSNQTAQVGASSNGHAPPKWREFYGKELHQMKAHLAAEDNQQPTLDAALAAVTTGDYNAFKAQREKLLDAGFQLA